MASICILAACNGQSSSPAMPAPPYAEQRLHIVSPPAGDRNDPYYWLRDGSRQDVELLTLLEAENDYTRAVLADHDPLMVELAEEMRERIPEEQIEAPYYDNGYWYYTRFEADGEYPIYARRKGSMEAPGEVLLDGNRMGQGEANFRIGGWDVSSDGGRLVWLQDVVGRRQFRMMVRDLDRDDVAGGDAADTGISGVSSASRAADGNPDTLGSFRVRRHVPGSSSDDEIVYEEGDTAFYTLVGRTRSDRFNYIFLRSTGQA